ncbi:MAG: polymer-forming cytoskeletal protein [Myxococcales bacterium]|nr:polymer-forming cytoskeletal protein [Myxococcales bacterium]
MALKDLMGMAEKPAEGRVGAIPNPAAPPPRTVAPATSIDAATRLSGKIYCKETIRIDGRIKGEVHCDKTVIIGEGAQVEAAVHADSIIISGEVKGNIVAKRKITLNHSARMIGDLSTPGIVIEEGAKLEGQIVIGGEAPSAATKKSADRQAAQKHDSLPASPSGASQGAASSAN